MQILKCENIHMNYDSTKAVNGVSFTVDEGDFLCIVGENGAGKSTLLKGILGLQKISEGKVEFNGIKKSGIGYLPQKRRCKKIFRQESERSFSAADSAEKESSLYCCRQANCAGKYGYYEDKFNKE